MLSHQGAVVLDAVHMCQVQEIALVAAEEVVALQLLLRVLDGPGADILILRGVVNEAVAIPPRKRIWTSKKTRSNCP